MSDIKPLTRETPNTDPLGNKWTIRGSKIYPGLLQIYPDKPQVKNPDAITGYYTSFDKANSALQAHLDKMWTASDEKAKRNTRQDATATAG